MGTAAVLVGLACGGCASSSASSTTADTEFLSAVHSAAPDIAGYRSDTALIRLGHAVCDGFQAGASYEQLADRLALQEGGGALPSDDLGAVISAAVPAYCPQYTELVQ
jgi:hypothetical protein